MSGGRPVHFKPRTPLNSPATGGRMTHTISPPHTTHTDPHVDGAAHTAAFHGDLEALKELLQTYGKDSASFAAHGPAGWNPLVRV